MRKLLPLTVGTGPAGVATFVTFAQTSVGSPVQADEPMKSPVEVAGMVGRYDPDEFLVRAQKWRNEAALAVDASYHDACLQCAILLEHVVRQSFETPPVVDRQAVPILPEIATGDAGTQKLKRPQGLIRAVLHATVREP
jgi:hypothetical protein